MIVVRFSGGLGNQMFQYSFAKCLAIRRKCKLFGDITLMSTSKHLPNLRQTEFELDVFKLDIQIVPPQYYMQKKEPKVFFTEIDYKYDEDFLSWLDYLLPNTIIILTGYWQSYRFFETYWPILKIGFTFRKELAGKWKVIGNKISSTNSVMLNIRRGSDYIRKKSYHGIVDLAYLEKAISFMECRLVNYHFYIFSDDIVWCKENLPDTQEYTFVDEDYYDMKFQLYMQLMCLCDHFIISNSSFSWWAAFMGEKKGSVVIAPEKWFAKKIDSSNLCPDRWFRI